MFTVFCSKFLVHPPVILGLRLVSEFSLFISGLRIRIKSTVRIRFQVLKLQSNFARKHKKTLFKGTVSRDFLLLVFSGGKFAAGVNYTGGKLPPVSTTPAANLPPVSLTPVANNGINIRLQIP
jgi:hypothetical protein